MSNTNLQTKVNKRNPVPSIILLDTFLAQQFDSLMKRIRRLNFLFSANLCHEYPIELLHQDRCATVRNRPHGPDNAPVSNVKHPGGEMNSLIVEFFISHGCLACGEYGEFGVGEGF